MLVTGPVIASVPPVAVEIVRLLLSVTAPLSVFVPLVLSALSVAVPVLPVRVMSGLLSARPPARGASSTVAFRPPLVSRMLMVLPFAGAG